MVKLKPNNVDSEAMKSMWTPVSIEANFSPSDFDGLVGLEEITDYKITRFGQTAKGTKSGKKSKVKKNDQGSSTRLDRKKERSAAWKQKLLEKKLAKKSQKQASSVNSNLAEAGVTEDSAKLVSSLTKSKKNKTNKNQKVKASKRKKKKISKPLEENQNSKTVYQEEPPEEPSILEKSVSGMEAWAGMGISDPLLKALHMKGFIAPTQVQALTIPPAILGRRDILGAAETGSGKTLAFGLPILQGIIIQKNLLMEAENAAENDDHSKEVDGNDESGEVNENDDDESGEVDENDDGESGEVDENDDTEDEQIIDKSEDDESAMDEQSEESENEQEIEVDSDDDDEQVEGEINNEDDDSIEANDADSDDYDQTTLGCVKVIDNPEFMLDKKASSASKVAEKPLYALILTPTRELAVQVKKHITDAAKFTDIKVALVVGGLSSQKQERMLNYRPEIVVGTPGRLWELIQQRHPHLSHVENIRYLAIDETDRMLEKGHFEELSQLLTLLNDQKPENLRRQNFLFSATLSMVHEPPSYIKRLKRHRKSAFLTPEIKLRNIVKQMKLQNPKVVDITQPNCVPKTLREARIICSTEDKDFYLYYFLKLHPGRTLVFCNSIGCVQRLHSLFTLLGCSPHPLHSNMQQRQRLKNLERFTQNSKCVLVATDVAARGLDVPNVQHVIHYQVPRTAESYVHRSGRTARASEDGLTVLLMDGSEVRTYTKIFRTLSRDPILPDFPVEHKYLQKVKDRVKLARELDKTELRAKRLSSEESWLKKAITDMDIEVSDDEMSIRSEKGEVDKVKKKAAALRKNLSFLTKQPLFNPADHLSKKAFITSGILSDGSHLELPVLKPSAAKALEDAIEERTALKRKRKLERSKKKSALKAVDNRKVKKGPKRADKVASKEEVLDSQSTKNETPDSLEYPDFTKKSEKPQKKRRKRH